MRFSAHSSADYRLYSQQRVEPAELFCQIHRGTQQSLDPGEALVVAMDDSILRKSGRKIPGSLPKWVISRKLRL
jgi:hypothetical protein